MPTIKANLRELDTLKSHLRIIKKHISDASFTTRSVRFGLDWKVKAQSSVDEQLDTLRNKLNEQESRIDSLIKMLNTVEDIFAKEDKNLSKEAKGIVYTLKNCQTTSGGGGRSFKPGDFYNYGNDRNINHLFGVNNTNVNLNNLR